MPKMCSKGPDSTWFQGFSHLKGKAMNAATMSLTQKYRLTRTIAVLGIVLAYFVGYNIGEGDGYCHAKYASNPTVCDVP